MTERKDPRDEAGNVTYMPVIATEHADEGQWRMEMGRKREDGAYMVG